MKINEVIKLSSEGGDTPAKKFIKELRAGPHRINPLDDSMTIITSTKAGFSQAELKSVPDNPTRVHISFFQAYPQQSGVGSEGMRALQRMAAEHGLSLELSVWTKGKVKASVLKKFYKNMGFKSGSGGLLVWEPKSTVTELFDPNKISTGEEDNYYPFDFNIQAFNWKEDVVAKAIDSKGRELEIIFSPTTFFRAKMHDIVEITFMRDNKSNLTGWGDGVKVLTTVLMIIREYIMTIHYPKYFLFNAMERSRGSLYAKLVRKLANEFGYKDIEFPSIELFEPEGSVFLLKRDELTESKFTSKQQVIAYFRKLGKTDAQGSAAWERGWRGSKPKEVKPFDPLKHKPHWTEIDETINEASGYIPSEAEKNDPRWKMALSVDVQPETMKKNAKGFGNKISRAGIPPTAKTNGKV